MLVFTLLAALVRCCNAGNFGDLSARLPSIFDTRPHSIGNIDSGVALLQLPDGFEYAAFHMTGQTMTDGNPVPDSHDGMGWFDGGNGTSLLVLNHEKSGTSGGTTTIHVNVDGSVISDFVSLSGTSRNCAGGVTPWGTWLSCEESTSNGHGYCHEVVASATLPANTAPNPIVGMGRFNHEAAAIDPATGFIYETEDRLDSCLYRYRPSGGGNDLYALGSNLEVLAINDNRFPNGSIDTSSGFLSWLHVPVNVSWISLTDANVDIDGGESVREAAKALGAATFSRGEGMAVGLNNKIFWACTSGGDAGAGQVFSYDDALGTLMLQVESESSTDLEAPDNLGVHPLDGSLYLLEDGSGSDFIVGATPRPHNHGSGGVMTDSADTSLFQVVKNNIGSSELTGGAFSADGTKLFFSIQDPGIVFMLYRSDGRPIFATMPPSPPALPGSAPSAAPSVDVTEMPTVSAAPSAASMCIYADDTFVREAMPDTNYGSSSDLSSDLSDSGGESRILLKFPGLQHLLGSYPGWKSASLHLYTNSASDGSPAAHRLKVPWEEHQVTWNSLGLIKGNASHHELVPSFRVVEPADETHLDIDVTADVHAWAASPAENHGWVFFADSEDGWDIDSEGTFYDDRLPHLCVSFEDLEPSTAPTSYEPPPLCIDDATDTMVQENDESSQANAHRLSADLEKGSIGGESRILLQFPALGALLQEAEWTSASLHLYTNSASDGSPAAHRLKVPWEDSATWNSLGLIKGNASHHELVPSFRVLEPADETHLDIDVTADVHAWAASPAENHGWVVFADSTDGWSIASNETFNGHRRPRLCLTLGACSSNKKKCISVNKPSYSVGEPIQLSWKGASDTSTKWKVAITEENKPPKPKNTELFLRTCGRKKCNENNQPQEEGEVTMDGNAPNEGGTSVFPLKAGTYNAHLAKGKKSKSGGLTFTITNLTNPDDRF